MTLAVPFHNSPRSLTRTVHHLWLDIKLFLAGGGEWMRRALYTVETRMHRPRGSPCLLISGAVKRLIAIVDYALRSVTSIPVRQGWRSRIVQCVKAREEDDATGVKSRTLNAWVYCVHLARSSNLAEGGGRRCWTVVTGGLALLLNNRAGVLIAVK